MLIFDIKIDVSQHQFAFIVVSIEISSARFTFFNRRASFFLSWMHFESTINHSRHVNYNKKFEKTIKNIFHIFDRCTIKMTNVIKISLRDLVLILHVFKQHFFLLFIIIVFVLLMMISLHWVFCHTFLMSLWIDFFCRIWSFTKINTQMMNTTIIQKMYWFFDEVNDRLRFLLNNEYQRSLPLTLINNERFIRKLNQIIEYNELDFSFKYQMIKLMR